MSFNAAQGGVCMQPGKVAAIFAISVMAFFLINVLVNT